MATAGLRRTAAVWPGLDPVLVAGVTLPPFMEKAPDRKAVEQVRFHLGWQQALDLPMDYAGCHATMPDPGSPFKR